MTRKLNFVTGNPQKVALLQQHLNQPDFDIQPLDLHLHEIQAADIADIALHKAREAFRQVEEPLIVEDTGFFMDALNGFPGGYVRYILETIGVEGLLALMRNHSKRTCYFKSVLVYVDAEQEKQFEDINHGQVSEHTDTSASEHNYSPLWSLFVPLNKTLTIQQLSHEERSLLLKEWQRHSVFGQFVQWYLQQI